MTVKMDDALWAAERLKPGIPDLTVEQIAMNLVRAGEEDEDQQD